jgi:chaperonin cofactor prefoldin
LEKEQAALDKELNRLKDALESSSADMEKLKVALYAKFGKSINLER